MTQSTLSPQIITSIVFGLLQFIIGLISLWHLRYPRAVNGTLLSYPCHFSTLLISVRL